MFLRDIFRLAFFGLAAAMLLRILATMNNGWLD